MITSIIQWSGWVDLGHAAVISAILYIGMTALVLVAGKDHR